MTVVAGEQAGGRTDASQGVVRAYLRKGLDGGIQAHQRTHTSANLVPPAAESLLGMLKYKHTKKKQRTTSIARLSSQWIKYSSAHAVILRSIVGVLVVEPNETKGENIDDGCNIARPRSRGQEDVAVI